MTKMTKILSLYTDGACSGNPGPGGWGVVACFGDGDFHELGGGEGKTTNNRMEMQAAIAALEYYVESGQTEPITLYTDSEYLKNGITKWIKGWKKKGWKTSTGGDVLNKDLWELLDRLNSKQVHWEYVRGHAGNIHNERCDQIARAFSHNKPPTLQQKGEKIEGIDYSLETISLSNVAKTTEFSGSDRVQLTTVASHHLISDSAIMDSSHDSLDNLPREVRVEHLRHLIETLHIADEVATKGYLITSSELADLMDVNASAVTSRGDNWVWRNWVVSRVRREGNQILWQLERVDQVNNAE